MGPGAHVLAVCQPCVAVLAATAVMSAAGNPATPRSMALMAGPDRRAHQSDHGRRSCQETDHRVVRAGRSPRRCPLRYPGAFRRVYPGFVQLAAFMSMNVDRHVKAHRELYENLANGELEKAAVTKAFYDEIFRRARSHRRVLSGDGAHHLPGICPAARKLTWHGEPVDPTAIRKTMLLTVEGERDDIARSAQTVAAHDMCSKLRPYLKRHHMQAGVGHYGVFSGKALGEPRSIRFLKNVICRAI